MSEAGRHPSQIPSSEPFGDEAGSPFLGCRADGVEAVAKQPLLLGKSIVLSVSQLREFLELSANGEQVL